MFFFWRGCLVLFDRRRRWERRGGGGVKINKGFFLSQLIGFPIPCQLQTSYPSHGRGKRSEG